MNEVIKRINKVLNEDTVIEDEKEAKEFILKNVDKIIDKILDYSEQILDPMYDRNENAEFVAETLNSILPKKDWEYYNKNRHGEGIVKNIKGRGFPDWEKVRKEVSEKTKISIEELEERLTDKFLDNLFWEDVSFVLDDIKHEYKDDFVVIGRSGGYWGLDAADYTNLTLNVPKTVKIITDFIHSNIDKIIENTKEFLMKYKKDDSKIDDILDNGIFNTHTHGLDIIREVFSKLELKDYAEVSKKTIDTFKKLNTEIESIIADFEGTDRWVEQIIANEYYKD